MLKLELIGKYCISLIVRKGSAASGIFPKHAKKNVFLN